MSEAEELAERLEEMSECLASSSSRRTGRAAAALIRSQSERIAELERRQIKVRWEGNRLYLGKIFLGAVSNNNYAGEWGGFNTHFGEHGSYYTTESVARAAVEAAAYKMVEIKEEQK